MDSFLIEGGVALRGEVNISGSKNAVLPIMLATVLATLVAGMLFGALQGALVAYARIPAFIVTLGGFLVWRGLIFRMGEQGQTLSPLDDNFRLVGGGPNGSLGEWRSWVFAALGCIGVVVTMVLARRRRRRYDLSLRPRTVDIALTSLGCAAIIAGVAFVANGYVSPISNKPTGVVYPVVILILVTMGMVYISRRRRFGRYVYAIGGNPESARLSGLPMVRSVVIVYVLCAVLAGLAADALEFTA